MCVHPYRVGLPVGTYCSTGMPVLELPSEVTDLEAWIIAVLRAAGPDRLTQALTAAETLAGERFDERDVVTAMRRVLTVELARQH